MECIGIFVWLACVFYYFAWFIGICYVLLKGIAIVLLKLAQKIYKFLRGR